MAAKAAKSGPAAAPKQNQMQQAGLANFFKKVEPPHPEPEDAVVTQCYRLVLEANPEVVEPAANPDAAADVEMPEAPAAILPESTPNNSNIS